MISVGNIFAELGEVEFRSYSAKFWATYLFILIFIYCSLIHSLNAEI